MYILKSKDHIFHIDEKTRLASSEDTEYLRRHIYYENLLFFNTLVSKEGLETAIEKTSCAQTQLVNNNKLQFSEFWIGLKIWLFDGIDCYSKKAKY